MRQAHALGTCSLSNASLVPFSEATPGISLVPGPDPEETTILTLKPMEGSVTMDVKAVARFADTDDKHGMVTATLSQQQGVGGWLVLLASFECRVAYAR